MKIKIYDHKYLPFHEEIFVGEHSTFGKFRVLSSVTDRTIFIEQEKPKKIFHVTMKSIIDDFFEQFEGGL